MFFIFRSFHLRHTVFEKLKEFGVVQVYIKEEIDTQKNILKIELEEEVKEKVRNVLETK